MTHHGTKRAVRQHMLALLRAIPADKIEESSARLRAELASFLGNKTGLKIGIYIPLPHEVNLLPLLQEYPQHSFAAPRCLPERQLSFHHITDISQDTQPGAHGIPAPRPELPVIAPQELDILIIPGVAFTAEGERLGYGGGYYDRFIPLCPKAQKIALAFKEQILPSLPTEAHDLRIPHIIYT